MTTIRNTFQCIKGLKKQVFKAVSERLLFHSLLYRKTFADGLIRVSEGKENALPNIEKHIQITKGQMKQVQRMHKVFGEKKNEDYFDRKGAYLIAIEQNRIAVIKTPKGYFLLGGGLEENETDTQCICRECLEETGYKASVKEKICSAETYCEHPEVGFFHPIQTYYLGELIGKVQDTFESDHELVWIDYDAIKGKLYSQMQNWAIEQAIDQ